MNNNQRPEPIIARLCAESLAASCFRILISAYIYFVGFLFGDGPWVEGNAFGYATGFLNLPWMIAILIFNIRASLQKRRTYDKKSKRLVILAWTALAIVAIFTFLILSFKPPKVY